MFNESQQQQLINFKQHLDDSVPTGPTNTPEQQAIFDAAYDRFDNMSWRISFGPKSVTIDNSIAVYDSIYGLIDALLAE